MIMGLLANAAIGLGSGLMSIFGQKAANKNNLAAQQQLMAQQNAYNKEMFDIQNRYNSPAHQRMLLEQGNMNPDLLYGNSPASFQSAEAHPAAAGTVPPPVNVQNAVNSAFATPMELARTSSELQSRKLDNDMKRADLITRLDENIARLREAKAKADSAEARAEIDDAIKDYEKQRASLVNDGMLEDNNNKQTQGKILKQQEQQEVYNTAIKKIDAKYHEQNVRLALTTGIQNIELLKSRLKLTDKQCEQLTNAIAENGVDLLKAQNDESVLKWFNKNLGPEWTSIVYGLKDTGQSLLQAVAGFFGLGAVGKIGSMFHKKKFSQAEVNGNTIDWK